MPQKKTVKRNKQKKPAMKRQTQKNVLALAEKVEKEFRLIPKKLASIYRQELMNQKKQEAKWKIEFKKAEKAQKLSQQKQAALTKNPSSKSNTKQLALAKKANNKAAQLIKMLTLENNQLQKKNESLRVKQNKYNFLNTELAKLEKQMNAQNAETPKNNKTIAKKQKPAKTKLVKQPQQPNLKEMITEETPFMISSENENVEV